MKLLLTVVSHNRQVLGNESSKEFNQMGGSIGRSWDNAWVLPDPERYISSRHALIDQIGQTFYLTDTSSNGVIVAATDTIIGKGNRVDIHDGDEFYFGDYTVRASIITQATVEPFEPPANLDPMHQAAPVNQGIDDFLAESNDPLELLGGLTNNHSSQAPENPAMTPPTHAVSGHIPAHKESMSFTSRAPATDNHALSSLTEQAVLSQSATTASDQVNLQQAQQPITSAIPDDWDVTGYSHEVNTSSHTAKQPDSAHLTAQDFAALDDDDFFGGSSPKQSTPTVQQAAPAPANSAVTSAPEQSLPQHGTMDHSLYNDSNITHNPSPGNSPRAQAQAIAHARQNAGQRHNYQTDQKADHTSFLETVRQNLEKKHINADFLTPEVAESWLTLMPEIMNGIVQLLQSRAEIKNQFRVNKTILHAHENNPLKFSANGHDAINNLFVQSRPGFLSASDAIEQAFRDITVHQAALLQGLRDGMMDLLSGFSPETLQTQFDQGLKRGALMSRMNPSKYWELYKDHYKHYGIESDDDFQRIFGETFAKAYDNYCESQSQRL